MNTGLNIRDLGADVKGALRTRADQEGVTMGELATSLLRDALGVTPETAMDRWKRENAEALEALYGDMSEARLDETRAALGKPPVSDDYGDESGAAA